MHPSTQLSEALSWKLVSELHRRHPGDFTVIETHSGGGQYDCLSLWADSQTVADLNRVGGFNVVSGESNLTALYRRERRIHGLVGVVLGMLR